MNLEGGYVLEARLLSLSHYSATRGSEVQIAMDVQVQFINVSGVVSFSPVTVLSMLFLPPVGIRRTDEVILVSCLKEGSILPRKTFLNIVI